MNRLAIKNGYYVAITKHPKECIIEFGEGISPDIRKIRFKEENGFFLYFENDEEIHSKILEQKNNPIENLLDVYVHNIVNELNISPDLIFVKDENNNYTKFYKE